MTQLNEYLNKVRQGAVLSAGDMTACIGLMVDGNADDAVTAAFLTALSDRGETAEEIAGAAYALRERAQTIDAPDDAIDCCGTGGDGANTYNISTAVAFVAAGCGLKIAKHGNRSASSTSGAADVLEHLGVPLDLPKETLERALRELGFCFLMAPRHHEAMRRVSEVRKSLGRRTIFNLLGPLANPAGTARQLVGVFDDRWVRPMAEALKDLGAKKALVVHGQDGLDEITLGGRTLAASLKDGRVVEMAFLPEDFGLPMVPKAQIAGGNPAYNAAALLGLLSGEYSPYRDVVLANCAALLQMYDGTPLREGVERAAASVDGGQAVSVLNRYKELAAT